jgi:hypothetical protein
VRAGERLAEGGAVMADFQEGVALGFALGVMAVALAVVVYV